jgi:hypothetical protein
MKARVAGGLITLAAIVFLLSGCLLTLGAPLTRKIEPDAWTLEAAGGVSQFGSGNAAGSGYLYAAKALGENWEIGLLPYVYTAGSATALVLTVPVRWDPFPHDWAFHLVPFAGPSVFSLDITGIGLTTGLGLSWTPVEWLEIYAAGSTLVPFVQYVTMGGGARLHIGWFQAGVSAMYSLPGLVAAFASVGVTLGGR